MRKEGNGGTVEGDHSGREARRSPWDLIFRWVGFAGEVWTT
jgi:hypothetical protein